MSGAATRRAAIKFLLTAGVALGAAPAWASEIEEEVCADEWWLAYLSGKDPDLVRHPSVEAERALQVIAEPLCRISTRGNLKWRVGLIKTKPDDVNAFTIGGGVIFIHDALLPHCTSETDLAAVLGHEIGHVEHRHAIKRMFAEQVLARHGIDSRLSVPELAQALRDKRHLIVADSVIFRSYTRQWEYQADAFAVRALQGAGYDHHQAPVFFETLQKRRPGKPDINTCIANTHPQYADRIARVRALAESYGRGTPRADSANFDRLMDVVG